eukprot:729173-Ditylum_brightwellii.AAC.1
MIVQHCILENYVNGLQSPTDVMSRWIKGLISGGGDGGVFADWDNVSSSRRGSGPTDAIRAFLDVVTRGGG